jgi:hypothetical protein
VLVHQCKRLIGEPWYRIKRDDAQKMRERAEKCVRANLTMLTRLVNFDLITVRAPAHGACAAVL